MAKNSDTSRDVWAEIAAPLNPKQIKTRQQPTRGGKSIDIRYIDARDVIHRLNSVVPGQWEFTWEVAYIDNAGGWNVKGKLSILGVVHEDVGDAAADCWGGPAKAAVSDALKRCAVHFGFGIELYGEVPDEVPQQHAPHGAPESTEPQTEAATELPDANKQLCKMEGKELYLIQHNLPGVIGIHEAHFINRWKKRYQVSSLKEITDTLDAFFRVMSVDGEE